jgi:DMSO/TMAO reductase YedYZ molybdopterin-dependent catalytic subunit
LTGALTAGVGIGLGGRRLQAIAAGQTPELTKPFDGALVGQLAFQAEPQQPLGVRLHEGLDTRLYADLSRLREGSLAMSEDRLYIRTGVPDRLAERLDTVSPWTVDVGGRTRAPFALSAVDIDGRARASGEILLECAGNHRALHFGLLGSGLWSGVPVSEILEKAAPASEWVLIEGFDHHSLPSTNSEAGCSWIFRRRDLDASGALLATRFNDAPLTPDHGSPVRLVIPGWYACCSVKWVTNIEMVEDDHPATSQMKEFAARTHQSDVLERAADFRPATIERSALPIRVEKWRVDGAIRYRVVGLDWGGDRSRGQLQIRFRPEGAYETVSHPPPPVENPRWEIWSHTWLPSQPGPYLLQLRVHNAAGPTRRLDSNHFTRAVIVDEV